MLHQTIFRSFNVLGVIPGRYFPQPETYYLFNLETAIEFFALRNQEEVNHPTELISSRLFQPLFSKALDICIGPSYTSARPFNVSLDSFFILRETDVVQFQYSEADSLFVSINFINLPTYSITPNFGYYDVENDQLIISCYHGGLCTIDTSVPQWRITTAEKPCSFVLSAFPLDNYHFFRVEENSQLALYQRSPLKLESKDPLQLRDKDIISHVFPFLTDSYVICTQNFLYCPSLDIEIKFPGQYEKIVFHSHISPSDVLLLTNKGTILRLKSDCSLTKVYENKYESDQPPINNRLRIFNLDGNFCLIINKSTDHVLLNLDQKAVNREIPLRYSTLGLSNIIVNSPSINSECMAPYSPQIISYSSNQVVIFRQGKPLDLHCSYPLSDRPTGIFSFEYNKKHFLMVSFENHSTLFEIQSNNQEIQIKFADPSIPYCSNKKTIAISHLRNQPTCYHVTPHLVSRIPMASNQNPSKLEILHCFFNITENQIVLIYKERIFRFNGMLPNKSSQTIKPARYDETLQFDVNCGKFLPAIQIAEQNVSEYIAFGAEIKDTQNVARYHVYIRILSQDEAERENLIDFLVPARVSSIEFNKPCDQKPLGILIGLENGSMIVGDVFFPKKQIEVKQILQIGSCPCHIRVYDNPKVAGFAFSSRLFGLKLTKKKNRVILIPFSIDTPLFLEEYSSNKFFVVSDKILSIYSYSSRSQSIHRDFTVFRTSFPNPIVNIKMWNDILCHIESSYMFVISQKKIFIMDVNRPNSKRLVFDDFPNDETIYHVCYTSSGSRSFHRSQQLHRAAQSQSESALPWLCIITRSNRQKLGNDVRPINLYRLYIFTIKFEQNDVPTLIRKYTQPFRSYDSIGAIAISLQPKDTIDLFIGHCRKLIVYTINLRNKEMLKNATLSNLFTDIKDIVVKSDEHNASIKGYMVYVADAHKSVTLLKLVRNQLTPLREEGIPRSISCSLMVKPSEIWAGDIMGNIFSFQFNSYSVYVPNGEPTNKNSSALILSNKPRSCNQRFILSTCMNVGDVVTGVACNPSEPLSFYYATIGGSIGCIIKLSQGQLLEKKFKLLKMVQNEVSNLLMDITHCDPVQFRNQYYHTSQICDYDLIDTYNHLSVERKENIVQRLNEIMMATKDPKDDKPVEPITLDSLELSILSCQAYFLMWNTEKKVK